MVSGQGTSAGGPLGAGLIALGDQYAGRRLGVLDPALDRIGRSPQRSTAFHDITTDSNGVDLPPSGTLIGYKAGAGWDLVTGWDSPDAAVLIPLLAHDRRPTISPDGRWAVGPGGIR